LEQNFPAPFLYHAALVVNSLLHNWQIQSILDADILV